MNEINICEKCGATLPTSTMQACEPCRPSETTQHTPAPWAINPSAFGERYIFPFPGGHTIATVHNSAPNRPGDANARLIAAAPDLLAACQRAWEDQPRCLRDRVMASRMDNCRCVSCALRAAIDKATGGDA